MDIEIREEKQAAIWRFKEDLSDPAGLREPMDSFLKSGLKTLILDLLNKEWLTSSEIGVAMWIYKELDNTGCKLYLLAISPFIHKTVKVTGIDQILSVFESEENALKSL